MKKDNDVCAASSPGKTRLWACIIRRFAACAGLATPCVSSMALRLALLGLIVFAISVFTRQGVGDLFNQAIR